jgi:23S rRNA (cytosine1962-C5)-methyltransferase
MTIVRVNRRAAQRVASGHPWVYSSDITERGSAQPGEAVLVLDPQGRTLGTAHYSSTSQIALRLLHPKPYVPDVAFYRQRIAAAAALRQRLVRDSNAFRLIHAEADLLPGLIVDSYDGHLSAQFQSQGMDRDTPLIVEALKEEVQCRSITARNDGSTRKLENLPVEKKVLWGEAPEQTTITMNGLTLVADILHGQKTGVFLDQRENYAAAARFAQAFQPRRALDCFTSSGGFALHLAPHCESVEAVDASAATLAVAAKNRDANGIRNVTFRESDVFELLARYANSRRRYELVVLDPPAFAKSRANQEQALRGYREINGRALRLLESGGVLITCSCSHHVSEADLLGVIAEAAQESGQTLRVLERRTQSADHPVLLSIPETLYLKCLVLQVV